MRAREKKQEGENAANKAYKFRIYPNKHELYWDSDGNAPKYPGYYRASEKKLKREQRKLSKMQKDSKNREKQRIKVARLHEKVANQRKDFLHQQSRRLVNSYEVVCIENLNKKIYWSEHGIVRYVRRIMAVISMLPKTFVRKECVCCWHKR